jgi:hypothetical protein
MRVIRKLWRTVWGLPTSYEAIWKTIPAPTLAQTERFARYVAGRHSWYKHLPIHPNVPFLFYLDPFAGMDFIHHKSGDAIPLNLVEPHWMTTVDYRQLFGHWNYHASCWPDLTVQLMDNTRTTHHLGPKVFGGRGWWAPIPESLIQAGTAFVSALMHPLRMYQIWSSNLAKFGIASESRTEVTHKLSLVGIFRPIWNALLRERVLQNSASDRCKDVDPAVLADARERFPYKDSNCSLREFRDWPTDEMVRSMRDKGLSDAQISAVCKYADSTHDQRLLRDEFWGRRFLDFDSLELGQAMAEAFSEIRAFQLQCMTDAMNRFVESASSNAH